LPFVKGKRAVTARKLQFVLILPYTELLLSVKRANVESSRI